MSQTYCVADCHGRYKELKQVLKLANFNYDSDKLISLGDECFTGDTRITTPKGYKKIKDINCGDKIITASGNIKKVNKIFESSNDVIEVKLTNNEVIQCTNNHPFFNGEKYVSISNFSIGDKLYSKVIKNKDVKFIDIVENSRCSFAVEENGFLYSKNDQIRSSNIPRFLELSDRNLRILGYFIGDGNRRFVNKRGTISFSGINNGRKECVKKDVIEFCNDYKIKYFYTEKGKIFTIHINSKILACFFDEFYTKENEKTIPSFLFNISKNQCVFLLYGLVMTDGCFDSARMRYNSVSSRLITDIISISIRNGFIWSKCVSRKAKDGIVCGRKVKQKEYYELNCYNETLSPLFYLINNKTTFVTSKIGYSNENYAVVYIKEIRETKLKQKVYNLRVDDDNTYIANNICVHNCDGGPDSYEVIKELLKIKNLVTVKANHSEWLLHFFNTGQVLNEWYYQGGRATLNSYEMNQHLICKQPHKVINKIGIPLSHIKLLESAKPYHIEDDMIFVHGGFDDTLPINQNSIQTLTWDRNLIRTAQQRLILNNSDKPNGTWKKVFVGHTSTQFFGKDTKPLKFNNLWCLDTGAGHLGKLTIMNIHTEEYWQSTITEGVK